MSDYLKLRPGYTSPVNQQTKLAIPRSIKRPIEPIYRLLGAKIEQIRSTLGWTQDDLGKQLGVTRASIANMEAGKQRILLDDVERIAAIFNTTPKNLLRGIWT